MLYRSCIVPAPEEHILGKVGVYGGTVSTFGGGGVLSTEQLFYSIGHDWCYVETQRGACICFVGWGSDHVVLGAWWQRSEVR
jgi:hypothetical protein